MSWQCAGRVGDDHVQRRSAQNYYGRCVLLQGLVLPLSNFYPSPVMDLSEGEKKMMETKRFKLGSFQMYVWRKAVSAGQEKVARATQLKKSVS